MNDFDTYLIPLNGIVVEVGVVDVSATMSYVVWCHSYGMMNSRKDQTGEEEGKSK
jgi:hypothetical protein